MDTSLYHLMCLKYMCSLLWIKAAFHQNSRGERKRTGPDGVAL